MKYNQYKESVFKNNTKVKEAYNNTQILPMVPVDDMFCEMMNWAVRYALGRRTYAASDTVSYILRVLNFLDDQTIYVMLQDIKENERIGNLGHEFDVSEWMKLKESIEKEIEKRKNNS